MIALVTHLNGVAFALFHVEHSAGETWRFRWRIASPCPAGYGEWREAECSTPRVLVQPEIHGCEVDVLWAHPESGEWCQSALHIIAAGACWFRVRALEDFRFPDEPLTAISVVDDTLVAEYSLPPVDLAAGDYADVIGTASGPWLDNVLHTPGEFATLDPRLRIENLDASEGSLIPIPDGRPILTRPIDSRPRRVWARVARNITQPT